MNGSRTWRRELQLEASRPAAHGLQMAQRSLRVLRQATKSAAASCKLPKEVLYYVIEVYELSSGGVACDMGCTYRTAFHRPRGVLLNWTGSQCPVDETGLGVALVIPLRICFHLLKTTALNVQPRERNTSYSSAISKGCAKTNGRWPPC